MPNSRLLVARALCAALGAFVASTAISAAASALDGTAWTLTKLAGRAPAPGSSVTLQFEGARAQGSDGCNRFTMPYSADGTTLKLGPSGASTQMACPPALTQQAEAFTAALAQARGYRVVAGTLELLAADGVAVATFAAQSTSLAGTAWSVTGFNNGRQAVVSVLSGMKLTMAFSKDGRVAGSAGCNRYTAGFKWDGARLAISAPAATRKMCVRPEGIMEQEQQFLSALETVASARFEGERLELRTSDGALAVELGKAVAKR